MVSRKAVQIGPGSPSVAEREYLPGYLRALRPNAHFT